jgi:hypothetical protein
MPVFHGDLSNWLAFHDLFVAALHNNGAMSGTQKRNLKTRNPAFLLQFIGVTDANYCEEGEIN